MECYTTPHINLLQKHKSTLFSKMFNLYRSSHSHNSSNLNRLKAILNCIKILIKQNFKNSINSHWAKKMSSTTHLKKFKWNIPTNKFYISSQINVTIPDLLIHESQIVSLESSLNTSIVNKDDQANIIVADEEDKLNLLSHSFEYCHSTNTELGRPELYRINEKV
jgi:hypothetical protein